MADQGEGAGPRAPESATVLAGRIMHEFADRTGVTSDRRQTRYLWTDAFAVCNCLTLFRRTGEGGWAELATRLIDSVHHVLGRHRDDDPRSGWISGLDDEEGERHPTAGGLRIGKPLPESERGDPYDPRLEGYRDGQYYHYLVRWMHALSRAGDVLGEPRYRTWSGELALAAHAGFLSEPRVDGARHLRWKMSIDLTYPLVPSEGLHDLIDGLVTVSSLRETIPDPALRRQLDDQVEELARLCRGRSWVSDDPLGVGGLLLDACWGAELVREHEEDGRLRTLAARLWEDSLASLETVKQRYPFAAPATSRLAFRELGLAIGLAGAQAWLAAFEGTSGSPGEGRAREVRRYFPLEEQILATWLMKEAQGVDAWTEHEDINAVMLATALAPDEYLRL